MEYLLNDYNKKIIENYKNLINDKKYKEAFRILMTTYPIVLENLTIKELRKHYLDGFVKIKEFDAGKLLKKNIEQMVLGNDVI